MSGFLVSIVCVKAELGIAAILPAYGKPGVIAIQTHTCHGGIVVEAEIAGAGDKTELNMFFFQGKNGNADAIQGNGIVGIPLVQINVAVGKG